MINAADKFKAESTVIRKLKKFLILIAIEIILAIIIFIVIQFFK
jgi:hypothetical protein